MTADQSVYQLGQPIRFSFTETNVGTTPVQVWEGPSSFNVTQNGTEVWNSLVPDLYPYIWDLGNYSWATLQPGQSYRQTETWNAVPDVLPSGVVSGTFTVSNEVDPRADTATFQVEPAAIAVTLSTAPSYKLGQSVPLSLILEDTSASKVAINESRHIETVTVRHGSTIVYESTRKVRPLASRMLRSGHPLKLTLLWSGKPNQAGVKKLAPGAYTITVDDDGYAASTTVDLLKRSRP